MPALSARSRFGFGPGPLPVGPSTSTMTSTSTQQQSQVQSQSRSSSCSPLPSPPESSTSASPPSPASHTHPLSASHSRNDLFTTSWAVEPPPPRAQPVAHSADPSWAASALAAVRRARGHGSRPGTPPGVNDTDVPSPESPSPLPAAPPQQQHPLAPSPFPATSPEELSDKHSPAPPALLYTQTTPRRPQPHTESPQPIPVLSPTHSDQAPPSPPPTPPGSKTSSFFASAAADTPPPAPRLASLAPTPLSLSRASSLRARALPAPHSAPARRSLDVEPRSSKSLSIDVSPTDYPYASPTRAAIADTAMALPIRSDSFTLPENLSPLHQSPSLPPSAPWSPPQPPAADDIALRLYPEPAYLLGEGRYASVYLAAYKRDHGASSTSNGVSNGVDGRAELAHVKVNAATSPSSPLAPTSCPAPAASGTAPSGWTLCAAKRLAPDRESQTMGLREAFFLNRLGGAPAPGEPGAGRVYVVKLIAVKEEDAPRLPLPLPAAAVTHTRSVSDLVDPRGVDAGSGTVSALALGAAKTGGRQRSSTIYANGRSEVAPNPAHQSTSAVPPPVPRLVLVLEHAPLGTLDRLLRTSPGLVGAHLWGRWARESAEALAWVHARGVVHADVKPNNLLLTNDLHLRLSDFGSSLLVHPSHPPTDGVGLGTLPFSPPELVDPTAPFSFPVDIFALGATLYQCITGREPYRGSRPVEMVHHVRNGGLWDWEERERLAHMDTGTSTPAPASPYPSAWRGDPLVAASGAEVRRGGSLRVPHVNRAQAPGDTLSPTTPEHREHRLKRVGSAESLQASDDVTGPAGAESPAGIKLYASWARSNGRRDRDPIARLLREDDHHPSPPSSPLQPHTPSRHSSLRDRGRDDSRNRPASRPISRAPSTRSARSGTSTSPTSRSLLSPPLPGLYPVVSGTSARWPTADRAPYADGSPAMFFLAEPVRVPDDVRDVLRAMLEPAPEARPTAEQVVGAWDTLGVGIEDDEAVVV